MVLFSQPPLQPPIPLSQQALGFCPVKLAAHSQLHLSRLDDTLMLCDAQPLTAT